MSGRNTRFSSKVVTQHQPPATPEEQQDLIEVGCLQSSYDDVLSLLGKEDATVAAMLDDEASSVRKSGRRHKPTTKEWPPPLTESRSAADDYADCVRLLYPLDEKGMPPPRAPMPQMTSKIPSTPKTPPAGPRKRGRPPKSTPPEEQDPFDKLLDQTDMAEFFPARKLPAVRSILKPAPRPKRLAVEDSLTAFANEMRMETRSKRLRVNSFDSTSTPPLLECDEPSLDAPKQVSFQTPPGGFREHWVPVPKVWSSATKVRMMETPAILLVPSGGYENANTSIPDCFWD